MKILKNTRFTITIAVATILLCTLLASLTVLQYHFTMDLFSIFGLAEIIEGPTQIAHCGCAFHINGNMP